MFDITKAEQGNEENNLQTVANNNQELKTFNNIEFGQVRIIEENGKPLFCGSDVTKALGYANSQKALKDHCKEHGVTFRSVIDNLGRQQQAKFITEGNLYRIITHSKLPSAEKFETWVFDEVLPTIRKNGTYTNEKHSKKDLSIVWSEKNALVDALISEYMAVVSILNCYKTINPECEEFLKPLRESAWCLTMNTINKINSLAKELR